MVKLLYFKQCNYKQPSFLYNILVSRFNLWLVFTTFGLTRKQTISCFLFGCDDDELFLHNGRWKTWSLISVSDHGQRFSTLQTSNRLRAGSEPVQKLVTIFLQWSFVAVITTKPQHFNWELSTTNNQYKGLLGDTEYLTSIKKYEKHNQ